MRFLNKLYLVVVIASLASCFPCEDPILKQDRGGLQQRSFDMGVDKQDVVFYDLEQDSILATARPSDWDMYLDEDGLRLNYLRSVRVAKLGVEWHEKLDTVGLQFDFLYTSTNGPMWALEKDVIYVMDMGLASDFSTHLGYYKFMYSSTDKKIFHSPISSAFELANDFEEGYFSILNDAVVDLPMNKDYSLAFGFYTDLVTANGVTQDYRIFGAVQGGCEAVEVSTDFMELSLDDFSTITFNPDVRTNIGYDWKEFNLNKGAYDIIENKHYLIVTASGFQYKLRFTNFYNTDGISGHPSIEFQLF